MNDTLSLILRDCLPDSRYHRYHYDDIYHDQDWAGYPAVVSGKENQDNPAYPTRHAGYSAKKKRSGPTLIMVMLPTLIEKMFMMLIMLMQENEGKTVYLRRQPNPRKKILVTERLEPPNPKVCEQKLFEEKYLCNKYDKVLQI